MAPQRIRDGSGANEPVRRGVALLVAVLLPAAVVRRRTTRASASRPATSRGRRPAATSSCSTTTPGCAPFDAAPGNFGFVNSDLAFTGDHAIVGSFNGFQVYDISDPPTRRCARRSCAPVGRATSSVYGDLLFMSVEETRGRIDCGTPGLPPGSGQPRTLPRRADLRHQRPRQPGAAARRADLPRLAHAHHRHRPRRPGRTSTSTTPAPSGVRSAAGARGLRERGPDARPGHHRQPDAVAHRRHQGPARRTRDRSHRQPAADLHRPGHRRLQRAAEHPARRRCTRRARSTQPDCRTPTPATTSRRSPSVSWSPAPARATGSCSTSTTR